MSTRSLEERPGQCPACYQQTWMHEPHDCPGSPPDNVSRDVEGKVREGSRVIGRKDDGGKLRFDLVPAHSLEDLVRIYTYGSKKYDDRNWEKGIEWSRVFAAMMRHLWAFWGGETLDPESGMPHMAHAAWGCFTLLEYMRTHQELDDRPWRDPLAEFRPDAPERN